MIKQRRILKVWCYKVSNASYTQRYIIFNNIPGIKSMNRIELLLWTHNIIGNMDI